VLVSALPKWQSRGVSAIIVEKAIPRDAVSQIRSSIARGPFLPGKTTAVGGAAIAKNNLQLSPDSPAAADATEILVTALDANVAFKTATWIDAMMPPLFCRYEPGMRYGDHIDSAIMGDPPMALRCDIAVTISLNDAASYDGGELVIDSAGASRSWKGAPGDAIIYPADTLHRVSTVTRGVREVAIFWIQSMVRDAGQRRILYDLKTALDVLDCTPEPPPHVEALRRSYFNLIRMWANP
jgi:PKHD-type hydroxylase